MARRMRWLSIGCCPGTGGGKSGDRWVAAAIEIYQLQIVEPGSVTQEVGDASFGKPLHLGHVQLGDVIDERTVQPDQAVLDQAHHGGRRERLRAGSERKNGIRLQCWYWASMAKHAKGFVQHDYATSPTAWKTKGDDYNRSPVGTGPYVLKSWTASDCIVLEKKVRSEIPH
jgi:hypothetical protein